MIDFTENHVIVQDKESERLFKDVFESVFGKFPWSQQKNLIEYKDEKNTFHEVFFTGTRDDILRKKFSKFEEMDETSGIKFHGIVREGSPAKTILEVAKEEDIDLIVIGSSGKSGFDRFIMGSVAEKVVNAAKCAVLVIH